MSDEVDAINEISIELKRAYAKKVLASLSKLKRATANEDVACNNAGQGSVAGIGVGPQGEPPRNTALLKKLKKMLVRMPPNTGTSTK